MRKANNEVTRQWQQRIIHHAFHCLEMKWMVLLVSLFTVFQYSISSIYAWQSPHSPNNRLKRGGTLLASTQRNQQLGKFEELTTEDGSTRKRKIVRHVDYSPSEPIPFQTMWDMQKGFVQDHLDRLSDKVMEVDEMIENNDDTISKGQDIIIMLQHKPVYTLGTASDPSFINGFEDGTQSEIDIVRIERGGEVTYHGPGQLVVYPILDLREYKQDIHWYLRALEEAIIIALTNAGVDGATREEDLTGVWVKNKKIAALGVKVRRWVTMHGISINVEHQSLENFDGIVPCGLVGKTVCCVNDFVSTPLTVDQFAVHLTAALEEVFGINLVEHPIE